MRALAVATCAALVAAALSGCASGGEPKEPSDPAIAALQTTNTRTATPVPSVPDHDKEIAAVSTALTCESILPAYKAAELRASGYEPNEMSEFDSPDGHLPLFPQNGGVFCLWSHPDYLDTLPVYGYSQISEQQARKVQAELLDSGMFLQGEVNGFTSFEAPDWSMEGVYLFRDDAWYLGWTLDEALLVAATVSSLSER